MIINLPLIAQLYREVYGWVDRTNQQLSYYYTEFRSIRKQSRIFDSLCKMYALLNGKTLWCNVLHLLAGLSRDEKSLSSFRFAVIRVWYAKLSSTNGRPAILHYSAVKSSPKKRSLKVSFALPRRGHHESKRITSSESNSKECRLKCCICHRKTSFLCEMFQPW